VQSRTFDAVDQFQRPVFQMRLYENARWTKYPFALLVPQHVVERIMHKELAQLGHEIHWGSRVTGVSETDTGSWNVDFENGEKISARYVVGADGTRSMVSVFQGTVGFAPANVGCLPRSQPSSHKSTPLLNLCRYEHTLVSATLTRRLNWMSTVFLNRLHQARPLRSSPGTNFRSSSQMFTLQTHFPQASLMTAFSSWSTRGVLS
jgi:2-polyprenyl-6-methoxyphenol hydroxylase-like FAD-dependent oxidoreductase